MALARYVPMKQRYRGTKNMNDLIENLGNSLSFIVMGVLEGKTDQFDLNLRKLCNFFDFIQEEKRQWKESERDTDEIIADAKGKRKHIYEHCQKVSFSQLLFLARRGNTKVNVDANTKPCLQAGYLIIGVWVDKVLQEHYRLNKSQRIEIFDYINDWIDSYQRGYITDELINEMFIDDIGYDIIKGEKVS